MQAGIYCTGVNYYYICSRVVHTVHRHTLPVCMISICTTTTAVVQPQALCISTVSTNGIKFNFRQMAKTTTNNSKIGSVWMKIACFPFSSIRNANFTANCVRGAAFFPAKDTEREKEPMRKSYFFCRGLQKGGVHLMHHWTWLTIKLDGNFSYWNKSNFIR